MQTVVLEDIGFADSKHRIIFKCDMEGAKSNIIKTVNIRERAIDDRGFETEQPECSFLSLIGKVADIFVASSEDKLTL